MRPRRDTLRPVLRTIEVTDYELILLQAALAHYQDWLRAHSPELFQQATGHISQFVNRLHEQLSPRKEQIEEV